jgi:RND family efflux transporter MFP subunit
MGLDETLELVRMVNDGVVMNRPVICLGALLLAVIAAGCNSSSSTAGVSAAEAAPAPAMTATKAAATVTASAEYLASGPIIVEDQVDVSAQRDGVVAEITAEPGMSVKKGQLLARLDDRQVTADLDAARAKTRSTEYDLRNWEAEAKVLDADYARAEKMWEAQIIPKEQLEHAKYKAESDQWDVKRVSELLANCKDVESSLELELEKTRIRAPFDGVVARRYVRAGQTVVKNDRLFWVTATAPLRMRVTLPERFLGHVKPGMRLNVTAAENPSRTYQARIVEVSPVVDPASDTIEVLAQLYGETSGLRPGIRADLHFPHQP